MVVKLTSAIACTRVDSALGIASTNHVVSDDIGLVQLVLVGIVAQIRVVVGHSSFVQGVRQVGVVVFLILRLFHSSPATDCELISRSDSGASLELQAWVRKAGSPNSSVSSVQVQGFLQGQQCKIIFQQAGYVELGVIVITINLKGII